MNTETYSLISQATRAFRNTALILTGTDANRDAAFCIKRAKDNKVIAFVGREFDDVDGGFMDSFWIEMDNEHKTMRFSSFERMIRAVESHRSFPKDVPQKRAYSRIVNKEEFWDM